MRHLAVKYTITQQIRSYRVVVRIKSIDVIHFGWDNIYKCYSSLVGITSIFQLKNRQAKSRAQNTPMHTTTTDSRMKIFICLD
jgi:hypothetical protein